ncbi:hypothetical protein BG006_003980 [Podila minutissima]|uniref:Uncharacterized protein n=1 Tax=Podila minutissima TaxID=64525 RepID=A0A9P5VQY0_9FUNG|nr:hypothetical protein BG006_003980 [Podila minutissima]
MASETISTHTVGNDATTTIVTRTTTIVSEHEEIHAEPVENEPHLVGVVKGVRKTLRDFWFPSNIHDHTDDNDEDEKEDHTEPHQDPSLLPGSSVMRRAYDYWKTLTRDATETAKDRVLEAKKARDEAAIEARWAILGYKREAREALEKAEAKYREALAAAEMAHNEAHEKAKSKWFQAVDKTEEEVGKFTDHIDDVTHKKWDRFKAAVDSLAFNPPKYGCSPSSQYWFSRQNPAADSGWDCREIWDHPSRSDHGHHNLKNLPKKHLSLDKVHDTFVQLYSQAVQKAKSAPSATSFEASVKPVKDYYVNVLSRISRNEQDAINEFDQVVDKIKARLNEAKYYEEQTDAWLTAQWNTVADNAGDTKKQYEKAFRNSLKSIQNARTETYNSLLSNLQRSVNMARNNINEAIKATKDQADRSRVHHAVQEASDSFTHVVHDAEVKIKAAPKDTYQRAIDTFNKDTALLKDKLQHAAEVASKSASSAAHKASKSGSSVSHKAAKSGASIVDHATRSAKSVALEASKSASSLSHHASKSASSAVNQITEDAKTLVDDAAKKVQDAKNSANSKYQSATDHVRHEYDHATASVTSMWSEATPLAPLHRAQESCRLWLSNAHDTWFDNTSEKLNVSSVYGALLMVYLLVAGYRVWTHRNLNRMRDPKVKPFGVVESEDQLEKELSNGSNGNHGKGKIAKHKARPSKEEDLETKHNALFHVARQFLTTSVVILALLAYLERSGLNPLVLHSLFVGLATAQILQAGWLNEALCRVGVIDGVHTTGREVGNNVAYIVFGFAAAVCTIQLLAQ